jgi:hypothetical protein
MSEQLHILGLVEAGEISVEEGARRLEALAGPAEAADMPGAAAAPGAPVARPALVSWLWQVVLWLGICLMAWGGLWLSFAYTQEAAAGRLAWGWILLIFGVLVVLLGWWLQQAPWFSLRVREPGGPNIAFALPLPLGPIAWILRIVGPFVPQLEETGVDELLLAMRDEMQEGHPFMVEVNEGEGGEQVQIYFG